MVYGLGSFEFAIALVFAIVVCKDAMGVRLETGQAGGHHQRYRRGVQCAHVGGKAADAKLKEFVGHTPLQVIAGILLGIVNAALLYTYVF